MRWLRSTRWGRSYSSILKRISRQDCCLTQTRPLSRISKIDSIPQTGKQYDLCAVLLEKRLVDFCQAIQTVYPEGRALPKHYREALLLCERELPGYRSHIDDLTLRQKLDEFFEKRRSEYPSELAEQNLMRRDYGWTYWWYYYYQ